MNKRGGIMENNENDVIDENLTTRQVLLLHGYKPALLPWDGAIEFSDEKAKSAN